MSALNRERREGLRFVYVFLCDACDDVTVWDQSRRWAQLGPIKATRSWLVVTNGLVLAGIFAGLLAGGGLVVRGVLGLLS
jgi:hypothetical protein